MPDTEKISPAMAFIMMVVAGLFALRGSMGTAVGVIDMLTGRGERLVTVDPLPEQNEVDAVGWRSRQKWITTGGNGLHGSGAGDK